MNQEDIVEWQQIIGAKPDGIFGPKSAAATEAYFNRTVTMKTGGKAALVAGLTAAVVGLVATITAVSDKRQKVIRVARGELGPANPDKYWGVVQPALMGNPTGISWCGGLALWVLHQALGVTWPWEIGRGFASKYLKTTTNPQPGDIAYFDAPFQHHAIVVSAENGVLKTIDGNQAPGESVTERTRKVSDATAFYSIAALV